MGNLPARAEGAQQQEQLPTLLQLPVAIRNLQQGFELLSMLPSSSYLRGCKAAAASASAMSTRKIACNVLRTDDVAQG
jgi:hypothetical protein